MCVWVIDPGPDQLFLTTADVVTLRSGLVAFGHETPGIAPQAGQDTNDKDSKA